ncbi:MAG: AroM family protein [Candidatus Bathyarchaeia archaeon]|nr:AroM family protein [Candidatus Bathyarchaeota archaeon]
MKKIGLVTLGQSPRTDILPDMMMILGQEFEVLEAGALDDYTSQDVEGLPIREEDEILVTRMRDGREVKVTKSFIVPLIQKRISELEEDVEIILLLCTGRFPEFKSKALIVTPSEIVRGAVNAAIRRGRLGVVYPAKEQTAHAHREWGREGLEVYADAASPYGSEDEISALAERLAGKNLDLIVLNCMGFGYRAKLLIRERTGRPVIQANALVARVLKEIAS